LRYFVFFMIWKRKCCIRREEFLLFMRLWGI
jgi:hypothetical protein